VVFERTWTQGDVAYAALAQVAVDGLAGADRMPAEGEALLEDALPVGEEDADGRADPDGASSIYEGVSQVMGRP